MRTKRLAVIHCCKQTNTKTKTEKEKNCCDKIKKYFILFLTSRASQLPLFQLGTLLSGAHSP